MVVGALLYVARYAHNVPYYDDWTMIDTLSGHRLSLGWLWEQHNEHRNPIAKLVLLALYGATGWDSRAGMYFNVVVLAALAWALTRVAARVRGGPSYADAVFPMLLLHWGHYENLMWMWEVTQVIPVVIIGALLAVMARWGTRPSPRAAVLAAAGVAALPLCGILGVVCAPGFVLWLLLVGRHVWVEGKRVSRAAALVVWSLAATAAVLVPVYFIGLQSNARMSFAPWPVATTMARFLAIGFGPAAWAFMPLVSLLAAALLAAAIAVLLPALRSSDVVVRSRASALLLFLVAFGGLAFSVGTGRTGSHAFPNRYCLFAVPALCWIYLTWDAFSPALVRRGGRVGLFLLVLALSGINFERGLAYARERDNLLTAMETDIKRGRPPSWVIARHQRTVLPFPGDGSAYAHDGLGAHLADLRAKGVGVFASLRAEDRFREVPLDDVAVVTFERADTSLTWKLPPDAYVYGVRVQRPPNGDLAIPTTIFWRHENERFAADRRGIHWWYAGQKAATFWIYDTVHEFRMGADTAADGGRRRVALLVPDSLGRLESLERPKAKK